VTAVRDPAQVKPAVVTVGPGGQHRVISPDAGTDAVGEGNKETRA
jgi:hypothetical protein